MSLTCQCSPPTYYYQITKSQAACSANPREQLRGAERCYRASEGVAGRCGHLRGVVGIHRALLRPAARLMSTLQLES